MSPEDNVLTDKMPSSNLNYFLFYFGNVAEADSSDNERAVSLIAYLCGCAFQVNYQGFAKKGEMDGEMRSYIIAHADLCEDFRVPRDINKSVEDALSLKLLGKQSAYDVSLKAVETYEEVGFKMKQKFFILSKAVVINEQI